MIAASAGNHAQGLAWAAYRLGVQAITVMPHGAPATKIAGVAHWGATVRQHGDSYDEAFAFAKELAEQNGYRFLSAFDDPDVLRYDYRDMTEWGRTRYVTPGIVLDGEPDVVGVGRQARGDHGGYQQSASWHGGGADGGLSPRPSAPTARGARPRGPARTRRSRWGRRRPGTRSHPLLPLPLPP